MPNVHAENTDSPAPSTTGRGQLKITQSTTFTIAHQQIAIRDALIRMGSMLTITGMSRSTYYLRKKRGDDVPQSVPVGDRSVRFLLSEVQSWVERQLLTRRAR